MSKREALGLVASATCVIAMATGLWVHSMPLLLLSTVAFLTSLKAFEGPSQ